jgi:hypothetical protein
MSKIIILILSVCLIQTNCLLFGDKTTTTTKLVTTLATTTTKSTVTTTTVKLSSSVAPAINPSSKPSLSEILLWNENSVSNWLSVNKINIFINTKLHSFNGVHLYELYQYQSQSPHVYHDLIKQPTVDVSAFVKFSYELKKLFKF